MCTTFALIALILSPQASANGREKSINALWETLFNDKAFEHGPGISALLIYIDDSYAYFIFSARSGYSLIRETGA